MQVRDHTTNIKEVGELVQRIKAIAGERDNLEQSEIELIKQFDSAERDFEPVWLEVAISLNTIYERLQILTADILI